MLRAKARARNRRAARKGRPALNESINFKRCSLQLSFYSLRKSNMYSDASHLNRRSQLCGHRIKSKTSASSPTPL